MLATKDNDHRHETMLILYVLYYYFNSSMTLAAFMVGSQRLHNRSSVSVYEPAQQRPNAISKAGGELLSSVHIAMTVLALLMSLSLL